MRIYIDADGCPVVDSTLRLAAAHRVETVILCDTSHEIQRPGVQTVTVSKGADSVDFALVNRLAPGDVVITQDYGLAAMCLAKRAKVLHQDGMRYSPDNIDALLLARHTARKIRQAGGRAAGQRQKEAGAGQSLRGSAGAAAVRERAKMRQRLGRWPSR